MPHDLQSLEGPGSRPALQREAASHPHEEDGHTDRVEDSKDVRDEVLSRREAVCNGKGENPLRALLTTKGGTHAM